MKILADRVFGAFGLVPFLALIGFAGCITESSEIPDGALPLLLIERVEPTTVLPGTVVRIVGSGFAWSTPENYTVELRQEGRDPWGQAFEVVDDNLMKFRVDPGLFNELGGPGLFAGRVRVRLTFSSDLSRTTEANVDWLLTETLTPELDSFSAAPEVGPIYLGSIVEALGSGFLMEGEGWSELRLTGNFTPDSSQTPRRLDNVAVVLPSRERHRLSGPFPPEALGIEPGLFDGEMLPVNVHDSGLAVSGRSLAGVSILLGPTVLIRAEPAAASRGQWIDFFGRGFVAGGARTMVRIRGSFSYADGKREPPVGDTDFDLIPNVVSGEQLRYVLRVTLDPRGEPQGLGARAGILEGTATPLVYFDGKLLEGVPLPQRLRLTVLPQKQVVWIKYLSSFTAGLRLFGLRNIEAQICARILEVARRDYQDYNVEFRAAEPTDFLEYSVIEIGGEDPNGRGLLGLDATMGKDTGNVFFDDYVGGWNAGSDQTGHNAFGGVFVDSFIFFSPNAPKPNPMEGMQSPRFDQIFDPFMPSRGGTPVDAAEYPDGSRAQQIELAIHVFGTMIGSCITHEIGHTLGLVYANGNPKVVHNIPGGPNQLMDGGIHRPFEERAEIDGQGPATWTKEDRQYLQRYLPK